MKLIKPINILVQRRAAIGDVIMSTGVVRQLKKQYGDNCAIDVATDYGAAYVNNPHVRSVLPVASATPAGYDVYINLDDAYEYNPTSHYIDNYFYRAFGSVGFDKSVELFPTDEDISKVDRDLEDFGDKFIVVHMRNWHWQAKNISTDVWFEVFAKLFTERTDFNIVCVGGTTDFVVEDHPLIFDARDVYNERQLKYLCDNARAFVGIDSGPFWAAAASKTHIVSLLTHLDPLCIVPFRDNPTATTVVQTNESCRGCNAKQALPVRQIVCEKTNYPCVNNFDTDAIANAILNQLK